MKVKPGPIDPTPNWAMVFSLWVNALTSIRSTIPHTNANTANFILTVFVFVRMNVERGTGSVYIHVGRMVTTVHQQSALSSHFGQTVQRMFSTLRW